MSKFKKILTVLIICLMCFSSMVGCIITKSDEELIELKINQFLNAYNSGDMDSVLECLDSKTRNTYESAMNIGNALIGKSGFKIGISDLFGIAVGTISEEDILTISEINIAIKNETEATVDVTLAYKDKISDTTEAAYFTMVKEDNEWFINNFQSK